MLRPIAIMSHIDEILEYYGGIQSGFLTEVYGEAGTGKTHICMAMMINTIIEQPQAKVIYISTAKQMQVERFLLLLKFRLGKKQKDKLNQCSQNCIIQHLNDHKILEEYLLIQLPKLLEFSECRLIIVDNISHYFQESQITMNQMQRVASFKKLSNHFRNIAKKYGLAVVVINNAVAGQNGKLLASLGPKWSEVIDERILVERKGVLRILKLDMSHRLPYDEVTFSIQEAGLMPVLHNE